MINETKSSNGDSNEMPVVEVDELDYDKLPKTTYIVFDYDPKKVKLATGEKEHSVSEKSIFKYVLFDSQIINLKGEYDEEKQDKKTGTKPKVKKKAISKETDDKKDKEVKKVKNKNTQTTKKATQKTKTTKATKTSQAKEDR